jgi:glucose/arabinose dehydrogenase
VKATAFARGIAGFAAIGACLLVAAPAPVHGANLPSNFQDSVVFGGMEEPTAFRFSPDGRVFVAEKSGEILVFDGLEDDDPSQFADLRAQVYDNGDRGLLGLALDPNFPVKPYVYALYTFDHVIGEDAPGVYPRWGQPPDYAGDTCPKPGSADVDACPVSGRLLRLTAGDSHAVAEKVLLEDWCQQTSSHSIGDLEFGPEGALFASGGDGASFLSSDYGQFGWPQKNQCDDPPDGMGVALEPPEAEGGALRSQDVRTLSDPTGLDGTVVRIDPETGAGLPDNPFASSPDANARRIVAFGFRNPFRFAIDPEAEEVYANNVGNGTNEEIDRFSVTPSLAYNSGWPCYEGSLPNPGFQDLDLSLCESLYGAPGSTSPPFFTYRHGQPVAPGDPCPSNFGSAVSGSAFYEGSAFPAAYDGALFFADSVRGCIYVMFAGADGRPSASTTKPFLTDGGLYPGVDIQIGPEGNLYYLSLYDDEFGPGAVHRISYFSGNQPPLARLTGSPQLWGASPLSVTFDATDSTDADGEELEYEWDPEGDGTYETPTTDGTEERVFAGTKNRRVAVRVVDEQGAIDVERVTVYPGDTPPEPEIVDPTESSPDSTWGVGQAIEFEGGAEDAEDGSLAAGRLDWSSRLYHCPGGPSSCHAHPLLAFPSVDSGTLVAPDHDYPSYIELSLTATDLRGLSATRSIKLDPRTVKLEIGSEPPGVTLTAGLRTQSAPFSFLAIEGSSITLSGPQTTQLSGTIYAWRGWSDGGARVHTVVADSSAEYTASYAPFVTPTGGKPASPAGKATGLQTVLGKHPRKRTSRRTARFSFHANGLGVHFRCRIDAGTFRPCESPRVYRRLRPGRHTFRVVAVDPSGKAASAPTVFSWRVLGEKR